MNTLDFKKSKIYKITNDDLPNMVYIGSTTRKLNKRYTEHKHDAFNKDTRRPSKAIKLFETGTPKIELIEEFECDSKYELEKRERWYIENTECINTKIPTRTPREYRKLYYEKNKEYLKEYNKKRYLERKAMKNKDTPPTLSDHTNQ
jgi:hypothetical protein